MIEHRPAAERGHANHGWLDSWHSFSFGDYYDPAHMGFGALRVLNDDRVEPGRGFGTHGHRDMEIVSYVLDGELEHRDSMGTGSIIVPGDVQRMSAGRGVQHSEYNPSPTRVVHFLQIWIVPRLKGTQPSYEQRSVPAASKRGRLALIAAPEAADGAVVIDQDAHLYAGEFDGEESATLALAPGRRAYVHVARGALTANGFVLGPGDAIKLTGEDRVTLAAGRAADVLVFDLP